ncbi:MAG: hypothetical protein ACREVI_05720 [Steroidobacteraceae bacterium]
MAASVYLRFADYEDGPGAVASDSRTDSFSNQYDAPSDIKLSHAENGLSEPRTITANRIATATEGVSVPLVADVPAGKAEAQAVATFPEDAESKIWQTLAANQRMGFTSIDRVVCRPTICEIRFTGGPDLTTSEGLSSLLLPIAKALPMYKSGMMSSRVELSPGVFTSVFVIRSYIGSELLEDVPIRAQ